MNRYSLFSDMEGTMRSYDDLVKYAYELVKIVHNHFDDGNRMAYFTFLNGLGYLKVESNPNYGHNYHAVIDAIHMYQKEYSDKAVKEGYYDAIIRTLSMVNGQVGIQTVLNYIYYELYKEKEGTNSFELNWNELLKQLETTIQNNYLKMKEDNADIDSWLAKQNDYINEKYGRSFWINETS